MNNYEDIFFLMDRSRFRMAISKLNEHLSQNSEDDTLYFLLSFSYHKLNELNKAETAIKRALQIKPNSSDFLYRYGIIELSKGNRAKAYQLLDDSLALDPKNERVFVLRSHVSLNDNHLKDAVFYAEKALSLNPNSLLPKNILSLDYIIKKKNTEAEDLIKQILHTDAHNTFGLTNLAIIRINEKKTKESVSILKDLIKNNPHDKRVIKILKTAIVAENKFTNFLNRFSNNIQKYIPLLFFFFFISILLIIFNISINMYLEDRFNLDLITLIILSSMAVFVFSYNITAHLARLALLKDEIGKHLIEKEERILVLTTASLFSLGLFSFLAILFPQNYINSFQIGVVGMSLIYASSIPFNIYSFKEKYVKIRLAVLNIIFLIIIISYIVFFDLRWFFSIAILVFLIVYLLALKAFFYFESEPSNYLKYNR